MDLCEEEIRINHEGYVLKSLMAYVNGLLPALLILALSSKTSGNLICHDLINFVTEGKYLYIRVVYLVSLQIDAYFGSYIVPT